MTQEFASKDAVGTGGSTLNATDVISDGDGGGNYAVTLHSAAGTITPAALTISAVTDSKTYDGTMASAASPAVGTLYGTDSVVATQAFGSKDVLGTDGSTLSVVSYTVSDGNGGADYLVSTTTAAGTITLAALTISAVTDGKTYDGTTTSAASPAVGTLYGTDSVVATQAFGSKDVLGTDGSTLAVVSYTVSDGNGGADYLVSTTAAAGTITPAALTISAVTDGKTYDGTMASAASPAVGMLYGTDTVVATQAFGSKHVLGTDGSTLSVASYTVSDGNGGADYLVSTTTAAGTITPAALTISAVTDSKPTMARRPRRPARPWVRSTARTR